MSRSLRASITAVLVLWTCALAACTGTRPLTIAVEADPELVRRGVIAEVSLLRGGCGSTDAVYTTRARLASAATLPVPPPLEAGRWALSARMRDRDCVFFAEGCVEIMLPSEREVLAVTLVETDLREAACPADQCTEGLCAGLDGDPAPTGPAVPRLVAPPPLASTGSYRSEEARRPTFAWARTAEVVEYELALSAPCTAPGVASCDFDAPIASLRTAETSLRPDAPITDTGARIAWRVRGCDAEGVCSAWSPARLLDVGRDPADLDADGLAEIVLGATGTTSEGVLFVSRSASPTALTEIERRSGSGLGRAIALGDADGDGRAEAYVGEPLADVEGAIDAGRVVRLRGDTVEDVLLGAPVAGAAAGSAICVLGDVDGDGYRDLAVGAPQEDAGDGRVGAVLVLRGQAAGFAAPVTIHALDPQPGARFGEALAGGDLDDDGYADLVVGEPRRTPALGLDEAGAVYVFRGGPGGISEVPSMVLEGPRLAAARFGTALAVPGDLDGDRRDDLAVGAPGDTMGGVVVLSGGDAGPIAPGASLPSLRGAANRLGAALGGPGDVDGDGLGDLLVGAPDEADGGAAYLYRGASGGLALAPSRILDATAGIGSALAIVGDVDGDGRADAALASTSAGLALHPGEALGVPALPSRTVAPPAGLSLVTVGVRGR